MHAIHLHTREAGVTYNIFTPPSNTSSVSPSTGGWVTGVQYYSFLLVADAVSTLNVTSGGTTGSVVVDLNLDNPTQRAGYAIYNADEVNTSASSATPLIPRSLVLFNFMNDTETKQSFSLPSSVVHDISSNQSLTAHIKYLTAPSLSTSTGSPGIYYAGQTMDESGNGLLSGAVDITTIDCTKGCDIDIQGVGAAMVYLFVGSKADEVKSNGGSAASMRAVSNKWMYGALSLAWFMYSVL